MLTYRLFHVICIVALITSISLACAGTAMAQDSNKIKESEKIDDMTTQSLDELLNKLEEFIVVTASRREQKMSDVPATVSTITAEDIERSGALNLAEILRDAVGVVVTRHSGNFPQYSITMRGLKSDFMNERTLVMIDGAPIYHPHAGGIDPSWIPLSNVKKIEVIKGPVSALYGANAFGGLVNVITKSGVDNDSFTSARVGVKTRKDLDSDETISFPFYAVNIGGNMNKFDYFLSADGFTNSDGYMEKHQGQESIDALGKLGFQFNEKVRASVTGFVSNDQQNVGYDNAPDPFENDLTHVSAYVEATITENYSLLLRGYFNDFSVYVKYDDALDKYETLGRVIGGEIQSTYKIGENHILIAGADARNDKAEMTTWEFDWGAGGYPPPVKQAGYEEKTTKSMGFYVQEEYLGIDKLLPIFGVRYDHNSEFGGALSPRFGLSYEVDKGLSSYLNVARAFRAPNYNEMYINGFGKVGNPNLDPEYTMMYEIGLKGVLADKKIRFNISTFRHDIENIILCKPEDPDNPYSLDQFINFADAAVFGVEAEVSHEFPLGITPFYNLMFLDTDDGKGHPFEKTNETKLIAGIHVAQKGFHIKFQARYKSDRFHYSSNPAIPVNEYDQIVIDEITTMDLFASKTFSFNAFIKQIKFSVIVENLGDKIYTESFASWVNQDMRRQHGRTLIIKAIGSF
ncbi:MAG: hypothetical protein B6244_07105 [Candidatus Cloacimonetes bacterium 4572_55]|nr:MAG: hypothetical protein B6244_07105 [Candidatus Cloacimonetes bacterium 4572_55]